MLVCALAHSESNAGPGADNLRCEFLTEPLGLDALHPRFSWEMQDERRGARQTAYEVQVSTSTELLALGKPNVWDSGKTAGSESASIPYAGPRLQPRQRYFWRVKIWDAEGTPCEFSNPTWWETGLLKEENWNAKWIGGNVEPEEYLNSVDGVSWISGEAKQETSTSAPATIYFKTELDLPKVPRLEEAMLWTLADDKFRTYMNGEIVAQARGHERVRPHPMTAYLKPGKTVLATSVTKEGAVAPAVAMLLTLKFSDGSEKRIATGPNWQTSSTPADDWTTNPGTAGQWQPARVVAAVGDEPYGMPEISKKGGPAKLLRREFKITKPVRQARIYATALGSFRFSINGERVSNDVFTPDWTDYSKRVIYETYDITRLLQHGPNTIGCLLGDGWYGSGLGWILQRFSFGAPPVRFRAQIEIEYDDGSQELIPTDSSWQISDSPILRSEIYAGETYDARREQPGWDKPNFDGSKWASASEIETTASLQIDARQSPPMRVTRELYPKAITTPEPGVYVFDLGQNFAGWARLRVKGKAGTRVRMRFAEILSPDGNIYRDNLRRAEATDTYILKGVGTEEFEPHFTYHGFRYVEVTGFPGEPDADSITGCVVHSDLPVTGEFTCSNEMVNQVWRNVLWTQRSNLVSVPTDCPQRDERLGWMGDAQAFWHTAVFNMDLAAFTEKWMRDVVDAQSSEGGFSNVSPRVISLADGAPAWGDAGIIVPYTVLVQYADKELVRRVWPAMESWMKYIEQANPRYIWSHKRNNDYGDWVPAESTTDKTLIATAYWAWDAKLMENMARVIGREEDAQKYARLFNQVRDAFTRKFIRDDGTIGNGSQTCYVLALHMGLVPEAQKSAAVAHLVQDIRSRGNHLSTGFLGSTYLMSVLSDSGHHDLACTLLLNETYPSWGYMVSRGATTIWERWNGDTADSGMNSYNHFCYGAVGEWLYRYLAGIDTVGDSSGFSEIVIHPRLDARLSFARASYNSLRGRIESSWQKSEDGTLRLDVTIPANTTAKIYVPALNENRVTESGKPVAGVRALQTLRFENGALMLQAGGGHYHFESRI
jgi:alpha-L-rhamnosidase